MNRYDSVDAVLAGLAPDHPVVCLRPRVLESAARRLVSMFPGDVLYAVKCNPHPAVLRALHRGGVRHFDTASLAEVRLVRELFGGDAVPHFNHPVKARAAVTEAAHGHGVRHFVIDSRAELDKVAAAAPPGVAVAVRLATPRGESVQHMSSKFGAEPAEAARLLRHVAERSFPAGIAFHVGSQCRDPGDYARALGLAAGVRDAAGVELESINVGGGLPAPYLDDPVPGLAEYIGRIEDGVRDFGFSSSRLRCEPGRALVADGCSILTQVHLRKDRGKDRALYINDGIFGSLCELVYNKLRVPMRVLRAGGSVPGPLAGFTLSGPTCDPVDVLPGIWPLPEGIGEGDWIEIGQMGAYSTAITTGFNGFSTDTFVDVAETPFWLRPEAPESVLRSA